MKTSQSNRVSVLRKSAENIENNLNYRDGIEFWHTEHEKFVDARDGFDHFIFEFDCMRYRVKPEIINFMGIPIQKPLSEEEIFSMPESHHVFMPIAFWGGAYKVNVSSVKRKWKDDGIFYEHEEEAIEASKQLFN